MRRLLAEPLLHFLVLGGAVVALHVWTREPAAGSGREKIVITRAEIVRLVWEFEQTRGRPPTPSERDGLIEARAREEVFYREAIAAGLGEDDPVVRRRLRQKLEFLVDDIAGRAAPTAEELQAYLDAHADRFRTDPRFTFRYACFRTDRREDAAADARAALAALQRGEVGTASLGDPLLMIETSFADAPAREVARIFGAPFARGLDELPVGAWAGPVRSGYGWHLVLVERRAEGAVPPLVEIRDAVTRAWNTAKREEMDATLYRELRAKYDIVVERE